MKFTISSLLLCSTIAAAALVGSTSASKPMLRASLVEDLEESTGVYGDIDTQITFMGEGISHALNRRERRIVAACFINSYNDAHATTGYQVSGLRVKMTHYHAPTNNTNSKAEGLKVVPHKGKWPFIALVGIINYNCERCPRKLLGEQAPTALGKDSAVGPPLNEEFVSFYQDCLSAGGYQGADQVSVGLFAPTLRSYMDPLITTTDTKPSPVQHHAVAQPVPVKDVKTSVRDEDTSESDISFYGLSAELSSADLDRVADCFSNSYNKLFRNSDWSVDFFNVFWQTVIGGSTTTTANSNQVFFADTRLKGFSYLLMDVSIDFSCTTCTEDKPDADASAHNDLENSMYVCLVQYPKTKAFANLESIEIRNMLSVSNLPKKSSSAVTIKDR